MSRFLARFTSWATSRPRGLPSTGVSLRGHAWGAWLGFAALTAGAASLSPVAAQEPTVVKMGTVDLSVCDGGAAGAAIGIEEFLCGTYPVPEDRRQIAGRTINLKVTVIPARSRGVDQTAPPVFALAGGPGQAAHDVAIPAYFTLQPAMEGRDLVLVDIRGTGGSNPLRCDPSGTDDGVTPWLHYLIPREEVAACAERLRGKADLTKYTTGRVARDLDDVREALGYERFALWGVSYGALLAQEIIRRSGESVEAAVLIGIAPPDVFAPMGFARALEAAKERVIQRCEDDEVCARDYPTFRSDFTEVVGRARGTPVVATITSPLNGARDQVTLEYGDFILGVRFLLYSSPTASALPSLMAAAASGNNEPLIQAIADAVFGVRRALHYGLYLSMRCTEDLPYVDRAREATEAHGTMLGTYRIDRELENCTAWPRGELEPERHSLVRSQIPVLLVSVAEDPVTPPEYGERVATTLPNSLHVVFAKRGHGFFDAEAIACLHGIVGPFLDGTPGDDLDVSCAANLRALPLVSSPAR